MSAPYSCCTKRIEDYYVNQTGGSLPYYSGTTFQKGYGLGGIFRRLFRTVFPFLMKGAKSVGKEALRAGTRIAGDVLSGENFKTSARHRAKESGKLVAQKAVKKAEDMLGKGKHKRKRKTKKQIITSKARKVIPRDIFDS